MFQISPEIPVDPSFFCCLILFHHSYSLWFSDVNRAVLRQGKGVWGEQTWSLSWFLEGVLAMEVSSSASRRSSGEQSSRGGGVGVGRRCWRQWGRHTPLLSSVVFRLEGPFPCWKFEEHCGAPGLGVCGVCWEKRTLHPSLNSKVGGKEPVDGAQDYTAQAWVL